MLPNTPASHCGGDSLIQIMAACLIVIIESTLSASRFVAGVPMFFNPVDNLIEPAWQRVARCTACGVVGVGAVLLLLAVLTYLNPVLP